MKPENSLQDMTKSFTFQLLQVEPAKIKRSSLVWIYHCRFYLPEQSSRRLHPVTFIIKMLNNFQINNYDSTIYKNTSSVGKVIQ